MTNEFFTCQLIKPEYLFPQQGIPSVRFLISYDVDSHDYSFKETINQSSKSTAATPATSAYLIETSTSCVNWHALMDCVIESVALTD